MSRLLKGVSWQHEGWLLDVDLFSEDMGRLTVLCAGLRTHLPGYERAVTLSTGWLLRLVLSNTLAISRVALNVPH